MRYPASEKLEIIRLVEQSHLPIKQTLDKLGIPRTTFYRWYDRYQVGGPEALEDQAPRPSRVWNRIPDDVRRRIVDLALNVPELSPRELAVRFTETEKYFVSEASVYRLLKSLDLITSPAFIVIKAADEFRDKTEVVPENPDRELRCIPGGIRDDESTPLMFTAESRPGWPGSAAGRNDDPADRGCKPKVHPTTREQPGSARRWTNGWAKCGTRRQPRLPGS